MEFKNVIYNFFLMLPLIVHTLYLLYNLFKKYTVSKGQESITDLWKVVLTQAWLEQDWSRSRYWWRVRRPYRILHWELVLQDKEDKKVWYIGRFTMVDPSVPKSIFEKGKQSKLRVSSGLGVRVRDELKKKRRRDSEGRKEICGIRVSQCAWVPLPKE